MKEKYNELFQYGIDFYSARHGTLMQNRYDGIGEKQIEYIENATLNFADMYEMLESILECAEDSHSEIHHSDLIHSLHNNIKSILKRARGE